MKNRASRSWMPLLSIIALISFVFPGRSQIRPAISLQSGSTYIVDRLSDGRPSGSGEGTGLAGDLRYALSHARANDRIRFSITGNIYLASALPRVTENIDIQGPNPGSLTIHGGGGSVFAVGANAVVVLANLTITGGTGNGGGIFNEGHLTLNNVTIVGNRAGDPTNGGGTGAGIWNHTNGSLIMNNCTVSGNTVFGSSFYNPSRGGGIANYGRLSLNNSTISGNTAVEGAGAGISNTLNTSALTLNNSTISANSASGVIGSGSGIDNLGTVRISNTIIAGNTRDDIRGSVTSEGHNLIGNTMGGNGFRTDLGDVLNLHPSLGPLQDNGGRTQTHALLAGSPAIDQANDSACLKTDQRGSDRPKDGDQNGIAVCDIGAFEYGGVVPTSTRTPIAASTFTHMPAPTATTTVIATTTASVKPGIPVLLSPVNGAILTNLQPLLDWEDSNPQAHHYAIQISTNRPFTALAIDERDITSTAFAPASGLTPGRLYYWRVRAFDANDVASNWSAVRNFRLFLHQPVLASPSDGESLLTDRPTLVWNAVPGASNYVIQVSTRASFSNLLIHTVVNDSEYIHRKDLPQNKTLYWRVRARTSVVASPWSTIQSFTTGNPASVPVLVFPKNGVLVRDYILRFDWKNSKVPLGTTLMYYQIQVDDNVDFSSPVIDSTSSDSEFMPPVDLASNTRFYWRVRAVNQVGLEDHLSGWARSWFRTAIRPPQ